MRENDQELLRVAQEAVYAAGEVLIAHTPEASQNFGKDIKISADVVAHEVITRLLEKTGILVLSEEDPNHTLGANVQWVVDPLDGSMNFYRGIPMSAISIALVKEKEILLGVVYDFRSKEMFTATKGGATALNGVQVSVSKTKNKDDAILMTGFPSYTDYSTDALESYISLVQSYKKIRLIGSAALSLAYVACGRADAYYEKDIKIWDVAAGLALVESAGGTYSISELDESGGCEVFASNSNIGEL